MPELPEVEIVKRVVSPLIVGRTIQKIDILREQTILGDAHIFKKTLENAKCLSLSRIGKFLMFHFDEDRVIISHLRMEGKFYELLPDEKNTKYARVVFHLDNGHRLVFDDMRCFGIMKLADRKTYLKEKEIAKLGPEPADVKDVKALYNKWKDKKVAIKTLLLSQEVVAGLGNIYVDEALFASQIHPHTPANFLKLADWKKIIANSVIILNAAIESGGSTIKSYHPGKGINGNFQLSIQVYGKANESCPVCGKTLRKTVTNGRGTTFCPRCQIKRGSPLLVAITGEAASGKSTVLNIFKKEGFATISSDDIVKELYKKEEVINEINTKLGTTFSGEVDKTELRRLLSEDDKKKRTVEKIIHPLVKEEIIAWTQSVKEPLKVVEVPLLYESKMDNLFDYIIATSSSKKEHLLKQRSPLSAEEIKKINLSNKFEEYKENVDFLLKNNSTIEDLETNTIEIINKLISYLN